MRKLVRKGDKVWRQRENGVNTGDNGEVRRIFWDGGDMEVLVDFFDKGATIYSKDEVKSWQWTDNYQGTWVINKERT
jgi:hypothetical protein